MSSEDELSTGATAGVGAASAVVILGIAGTILWFRKYRRKRKNKMDDNNREQGPSRASTSGPWHELSSMSDSRHELPSPNVVHEASTPSIVHETPLSPSKCDGTVEPVELG